MFLCATRHAPKYQRKLRVPGATRARSACLPHDVHGALIYRTRVGGVFSYTLTSTYRPAGCASASALAGAPLVFFGEEVHVTYLSHAVCVGVFRRSAELHRHKEL